MELVNHLYKFDEDRKEESDLFYFALRRLILLLAPFAPHLAEELWQTAGGTASIFKQSWPDWDESALETKTVTIVVQINGRLRASITVPSGISEDDFYDLALKNQKVSRHLERKQILKRIFIPGKLLSIVAK